MGRELRGVWEVLVVRPPVTVTGEADLVLALVAHADGRAILAGAPGRGAIDFDALLAQAQASPAADTLRELRCLRADAAALRAVAPRGVKVRVVEALPAAEAAIDDFLGGVAPSRLPPDPERWRPVLAELLLLRPWQSVDERVLFTFEGDPALAGAVALVVGDAGITEGVVLYASRADLEAHLEGASDWSACTVTLEPVEELEPEEQRASREARLVFGDTAVVMYGVEDGALLPLDLAASARLRAAVSGVVAVVQVHGARLLTRATRTEVGGRVVRSEPRDALTLVGPEEHVVMVDPTGGVLVKAAKAVAERFLRRVAALDAVSREGTDLIGWRAGEWVGVVVRAPPEVWGDTPSGDTLRVGAAAGGARRALRAHHVLGEYRLPVRGRGDVTDLPPFDPRAWDGPRETWPKASTVLLWFIQPFGVEALPSQDERRAMVELASVVWSCVVLADAGKPELLESLLERLPALGADREQVQAMIARKNRSFAKDDRKIAVRSVTFPAGRMNVSVAWS